MMQEWKECEIKMSEWRRWWSWWSWEMLDGMSLPLSPPHTQEKGSIGKKKNSLLFLFFSLSESTVLDPSSSLPADGES
jgi:hypothetical protein